MRLVALCALCGWACATPFYVAVEFRGMGFSTCGEKQWGGRGAGRVVVTVGVLLGEVLLVSRC